MFNFFICHKLSVEYECDIANYADDNTPNTYDTNLNNIVSKLEDFIRKLFKWFEKRFKANGDKCVLLVTTDKPVFINIEGNVKNSEKENFVRHVKSKVAGKSNDILDNHSPFKNYIALQIMKEIFKLKETTCN